MSKNNISGKTRHGVHDDDLVGFSVHIKPELKALAQVTANELKTNMAEVMRAGFVDEATRAGVMLNGKIVARFKPAVDMYAEVYRCKNRDNKAKARKESK